MTLAELNVLTQEQFVSAVGWVFEHSSWVAERAWEHRPFHDLKQLHGAMTAEVERATREEQLALLRAHPDLGARARMSTASAGEQTGAGLDKLTPDEFQRLHEQNTAYREKFGFPFLYAVKGSSKYDILRALEQRLQSTPQQEFREALQQVYRIAWFRLEGIFTRRRGGAERVIRSGDPAIW
jgi:2-oxo-4-hydroxy-4-carboxy-5-ureidoimidazoline decarboxylase